MFYFVEVLFGPNIYYDFFSISTQIIYKCKAVNALVGKLDRYVFWVAYNSHLMEEEVMEEVVYTKVIGLVEIIVIWLLYYIVVMK